MRSVVAAFAPLKLSRAGTGGLTAVTGNARSSSSERLEGPAQTGGAAAHYAQDVAEQQGA